MITSILNNKSVWKLLALISYSPGSGYTRKEMLNLLDWNNLTLDRSIRKLEFYNVIRKNKRIIKLNFDNPDTKALMDIMDYEKSKLNNPLFEIFILLKEFLRLVESCDVDSIYMFGSHAKKTASLTSDIDIAIFSEQRVNLIKAKQAILDLYGKELQLHYFKAGEKGKLVDEVMKHGVRLV